MNVFFDVDDTIICAETGSLRPMVPEVFERIRADGHVIYVWSGVGIRWHEVERHGLRRFVANCWVKPLRDHRQSLAGLGVDVAPEFVVDDHQEIVDVFGGYTVRPYAGFDPADREMLAVYERLGEFVRARAASLGSGGTRAGDAFVRLAWTRTSLDREPPEGR